MEASHRTTSEAAAAGKTTSGEAAAPGKTTSGEAAADKTTTCEAAVPTPASAPTPTAPSPRKAPAVPRTSPDEDSIGEPARPVVSVRRTGIRIIAVVSISTADRGRADSNPNRHLRLGRLREHQRQRQNRHQRQIFQVPHGCSPLLQMRRHRFSTPNPPVFQNRSVLKAPMYLNSEGSEKLQVWQWLISASLCEISQLRRHGAMLRGRRLRSHQFLFLTRLVFSDVSGHGACRDR